MPLKPTFLIREVATGRGRTCFHAYKVHRHFFRPNWEEFLGSCPSKEGAEALIKDEIDYPIVISTREYDHHGDEVICGWL